MTKVEQEIVEWLYEQVDQANRQLVEANSRWRFLKVLSVEEVPPDLPPTPTGNLCQKCGGMMKPAGSCEVCMNCGETSGGCS